MLRAMRNDFKKYSWTLWLVIIAFVGGFIVTDAFRGEGRAARSGLIYLGDKVAVKGKEYQMQLVRMLDTYKNQFSGNFDKGMIRQLGVSDQLVQFYISRSVVREEAKRLGLVATKGELKDKIVNHPWFQRDGQFVGAKEYKLRLAHSRMNVSEFEDDLKGEIISEKLEQLVAGPLVIGEGTLRDKFRSEKDEANLQVIRFKPNRITQEITVADDDPEIQSYYDAHKEDFKSDERRRAYVIAYKYDDFKDEVTVPSKEVYEYFTANKDQFRVPGKTRVSRILMNYDETNRDDVFKKIEGLQKELTKDNFADKSREFSQDIKAQEGGDYGYNDWQRFTRQERGMIDGMSEGDISSPVDTQKGFAVFYVSEKVNEGQQSFNDVKDRITENLTQQRLTLLVTQKMQKIHENVKGIKDIKARAGEMGVDVVETPLMTAGEALEKYDEMGYISRHIFSMDKEEEIAFPVEFIKGVAIVQLAEIAEPTVLALADVKDRVKTEVVRARKIAMLQKEAAQVSAQLNNLSGKDNRDAYLTKNNLSEDTINYKRGNKLSYLPEKEGLDDLVFGGDENWYSEPRVYDTEVLIFRINGRTVTTDEQFNKSRGEYYAQKVKELRDRYFSSFLKRKIDSYQVRLNRDLLEEITESVVDRYN